MCAVVARWSTPNGAYRGKHFRAPVGVTTTDEERHDCAVTFGSRTDLVLRYRPDALTA